MATKLSRTRFDVIREAELDMRCMVRDMKNRREGREELAALRHRKTRGYPIDEVNEARLVLRTEKLSKLILDRWNRLHRRMNRESARQAEVDEIFRDRREAGGESAHP